MEGCVISVHWAERQVVVAKIHVFTDLADVQEVSTQVLVHVQGSGGVKSGDNRTWCIQTKHKVSIMFGIRVEKHMITPRSNVHALFSCHQMLREWMYPTAPSCLEYAHSWQHQEQHWVKCQDLGPMLLLNGYGLSSAPRLYCPPLANENRMISLITFLGTGGTVTAN